MENLFFVYFVSVFSVFCKKSISFKFFFFFKYLRMVPKFASVYEWLLYVTIQFIPKKLNVELSDDHYFTLLTKKDIPGRKNVSLFYLC